MGIIRGGDAEYEEFEPSYKEKAEKLETILKQLLEEKTDSLKLSGKYISLPSPRRLSLLGKFCQEFYFLAKEKKTPVSVVLRCV